MPALVRFKVGAPGHNGDDANDQKETATWATTPTIQKGRIKEAVGDLTDNKEMKREGKVDRGAGAVKDTVDKVTDKIKGD